MGRIPKDDRVDNAPLREVYLRGMERGDFTLVQILKDIGFMTNGDYRKARPRFERALGIYPASGGYYQKYIHYDLAVKLVRAMGIDPIDIGV